MRGSAIGVIARETQGISWKLPLDASTTLGMTDNEK